MPLRSIFRISVFAALLGLVVTSLSAGAQQNTSNRGRKYKSPPVTARIEVTVLRDVNGKPIENAAVIFHPMQGEKDKGNMELKTNEDGKTIIDVLPIGDTVRMQIIAKGFQTFGDDYKVDKAEMAIEIRMKRPGEQYSIYKKHPETSEGGKNSDAPKPDEAKPANPPSGTAKDAGNDSAPAPVPEDKPAAQPDAPASQPK
ncbi:MAG: carboxypeptidase-like regulatory domain-containing protein [Terracidiphilus sp.]|jgi:hypothetical protein